MISINLIRIHDKNLYILTNKMAIKMFFLVVAIVICIGILGWSYVKETAAVCGNVTSHQPAETGVVTTATGKATATF
jgi:hypothetical protein